VLQALLPLSCTHAVDRLNTSYHTWPLRCSASAIDLGVCLADIRALTQLRMCACSCRAHRQRAGGSCAGRCHPARGRPRLRPRRDGTPLRLPPLIDLMHAYAHGAGRGTKHQQPSDASQLPSHGRRNAVRSGRRANNLLSRCVHQSCNVLRESLHTAGAAIAITAAGCSGDTGRGGGASGNACRGRGRCGASRRSGAPAVAGGPAARACSCRRRRSARVARATGDLLP